MDNAVSGVEKSMIAEQLRADQRRLESGAISVALHVVVFLISIWGTREVGIGSGRKNGGGLLARGPVEVTILEEHVDSGTAEKSILTEPEVAPLAPASPADKIVGYEEFRRKMAELSRAQKEQQQKELEAKKTREKASVEDEKAKAEAHAREEELRQEELRRAKSEGAVDQSLVEQNSNASGSNGDEDDDAPILGGGGAAINIREWAREETGRAPCPRDREYYNPGDSCRPYTQQLYQPMCVYDMKTCRRILKRLQKFQ